MANVKSIGGNPIVLGLDGLSDEVTHGDSPILSVGRADALTGADETAQWAQRESTGSGSAIVRSVQGAVVKFNQYADLGERTKEVTSDATWTALAWTAAFAGLLVNGHVYYASFEGKGTVHSIRLGLNTGNSSTNSVCRISNPTLEFIRASGITTFHTAAAGNGLIVSNSPTHLQDVAGDYFTVRNIMLIDLTQMFGAGNEPQSVAAFEAMYPASYYPYSAPTLKPVQITGIRSTTAQGGELDSMEWETQTLRAAGSVADELTAGELVTRIGVVDLGTLTWEYSTTNAYFYADVPNKRSSLSASMENHLSCAKYVINPTIIAPNNLQSGVMSEGYGGTSSYVFVVDSTYATAADFKAAMNGVLMFYELATPTTTPISPALPMTYRVQQGGSESIIVPDGEISAIPVLTIAEGESVVDVVMDALACIATPDGPTATANHSVGTYLTMGGKLYKVTSAIAVGETIVAGTNVTQTTVMAELLALTA